MRDLVKAMPKKVRIGWLYYTVRLMNEDMAQMINALGAINHASQEILIADGQGIQQMANSLLHEIIHGVHFNGNVNDGSTEEEFTICGANGLCQVMQDNPAVFVWLNECLKPGAKA